MQLQTPDSETLSLVRQLWSDARQSMRRLGSALGLSPPTVTERVRRLEDLGAIRGYRAEVDLTKLGWEVGAFLSLSARAGRCDLLLTQLEACTNVVAAYHVTGSTDYLVRVAARDLAELKAVTQRLSQCGTVATQIILETAFERLPG